MENKIFAGKRISEFRTTKGISQQELAERSGFTLEDIIEIEKSNDMPSMAVLIKLARAMGVRIGTFLDDHEELGPIITRANEVGKDSFSSKNDSNKRHMSYVPLSQSKAGRHMESFKMKIEPCSDADFIMSSHEGEEFIYVLEGEVEINYGKEVHHLSANDSIYYDSIVAHHVHASCSGSAQILAVIYTPL